MRMRRIPLALIIWILGGVLWTVSPAGAQFTLTGGKNGILGINLSAGRVLTVAPGTTWTFGLTYSEVLKTEPLLAVRFDKTLGRGWAGSLTASMGTLGGDYRVDFLPEINFSKSQLFDASVLGYRLDVGGGNYMVRPVGIQGYRLHGVAQVGTVSIPLGRVFSTSGTIGYRQYAYFGASHGAAWGTVQLNATPAPWISTNLTFWRQVPSGSSPLLFDALGDEKYLSAGLSVRPSGSVAFTHRQQYSLITNAFTDREYGVSVTLEGGHVLGATWDDVERKATVSYSRSGLGSFSVFWYP